MPRKGRGVLLKMSNYMRIHPSMLSQVLNGAVDLSLEQAQNVCEFFTLNELETEYFIILVEYERAGTKSLKDHFNRVLQKQKESSKQLSKRLEFDLVLDEKAQAQFYSHWSYSGISLLSSIPEYQNIDAIAEFIGLPKKKFKKIIDFLIQSQLCIIEDGKIMMGKARTFVDSDSLFTQRHHTNWRLKSIQQCDSITPDELMYTNPVTLSKKDFLPIREELVEFIKSFGKRISESNCEELAVLNIDWIKLRKSSY